MQCKAHGAQRPRQYKQYGEGVSTAQRRNALEKSIYSSELDALLRLDALLFVWMFDRTDIADQIRSFDQLIWRVASGDNDVQHFTPLGEYIQHFRQIEILVFEHDIEFVEDHHVVAGIINHPHRLGPSFSC